MSTITAVCCLTLLLMLVFFFFTEVLHGNLNVPCWVIAVGKNQLLDEMAKVHHCYQLNMSWSVCCFQQLLYHEKAIH
ncbi:hypothetical protein BDA96_01G204200 [Sorghum bicolor]|jgi:hypothetical protein|uniref:Secreted protein n=2 Tax=Sorghum bicolor TaxID=4558 RepID=A0A921UYT7_SORBI|nr:hypothetical protein BDA96_01G204200 [Sorghum bicolor]KXG38179.1 hypothetical protein SORBI_3001G193800 [Sorghum bicolor]